MSKPSMPVVCCSRANLNLFFVLLVEVVIDGKRDFIRNSRVSMPGSAAVPSGFLRTPKDFFF